MVQLTQQTLDTLQAYRATVNLEHDNGMLQRYPSDIVIDTQCIIEDEGAPFILAIGENGTHYVPLDRTPYNRGKSLDAIKSAYGDSLVWYVWEGISHTTRYGSPALTELGSYDDMRAYDDMLRFGHIYPTIPAPEDNATIPAPEDNATIPAPEDNATGKCQIYSPQLKVYCGAPVYGKKYCSRHVYLDSTVN